MCKNNNKNKNQNMLDQPNIRTCTFFCQRSLLKHCLQTHSILFLQHDFFQQDVIPGVYNMVYTVRMGFW